MALLLIAVPLALLAGVLCGGVFIPPAEGIRTLWATLFHTGADATAATILITLRLPRVLLAFLCGAATAAAGAAAQTCLRNPLASPFTLGASAGGALGAGIIILSGLTIPLLGGFTLPLCAILAALLAIFMVTGLSSALDRNGSANTAVLCGMVLSLFFNAVLTVLAALNREQMQRISLWQLGSFALRGYDYVLLLLPFAAVGIFLLMRRAPVLDILSFGDEQAHGLGVPVKRARTGLLAVAAVLTGASVAVCGIIGFVDLIAPYLVRRLFGQRHARVIPLSALLGGVLMVTADLTARVVIAPAELPVGAVTALLGAPFFAFVFFAGRRRDDA